MRSKNYILRLAFAFTAVILVFSGAGFNASAAKKKKKPTSSITFKKYTKTLTIKKGQSIKLKTKIKPSKASKKLKWTSSKKKVVSVSKKGVIKGKKKGKAVITVTATDGTGICDKLTVTVGYPVTGITFTNSDDLTEMQVGKSVTIKKTITPSNASNKKVYWTTSDKEVATVSTRGTVKAKSNGDVTITAQAADGSGVKAKYSIHVVTKVSSISLDTDSDSPYITKLSSGVFVKKGINFYAAATISPETASDKSLSWSSSNDSVASVDQDGYISPQGDGIAKITVQALDGSNKKAVYTVMVAEIASSDAEFVAHRGRSELAPDNSLAALRAGLESDAVGIETDIHPTTDGQFAVCHDNSLKDSCGVDVDISSLTLAQATSYVITSGNNITSYPNEHIPSLQQVLDLLKNYKDKKLFLEIKGELSEAQIDTLLKQINNNKLQDRVTIISFYVRNLREIRANTDASGDAYELEYLSQADNKADKDSAIQKCIETHANLSAKYITLSKEQIQKIHDAKLKVNVWTVDDFLSTYHMIHTMHPDEVTTDILYFE